MADEASGYAGSLLVRSLAETEELGRRIAARVKRGDAISLQGDLGAGKTTLARAILRALGVRDEVPSPSFTLVQEYEAAGARIAHCDLYRIESPMELDEMGMEEALQNGVLLVEWPERAPERIPAGTLKIHIDIRSESERHITLSGPARWAELTNEGP